MRSHKNSEIESKLAQNRIAEIVLPLLQNYSYEDQSVFLAIAERLAGARYREWAKEVANKNLSKILVECAEREEKIADLIEGLHPKADQVKKQIMESIPDLNKLGDLVFEEYPLRMQFAIQAQGERLGAARWNSYAEKIKQPKIAEIYRQCAELEMSSALELENILSQNLG